MSSLSFQLSSLDVNHDYELVSDQLALLLTFQFRCGSYGSVSDHEYFQSYLEELSHLGDTSP